MTILAFGLLDNLLVHSERVSLIVRRMLDQTQKWAMNFNKRVGLKIVQDGPARWLGRQRCLIPT